MAVQYPSTAQAHAHTALSFLIEHRLVTQHHDHGHDPGHGAAGGSGDHGGKQAAAGGGDGGGAAAAVVLLPSALGMATAASSIPPTAAVEIMHHLAQARRSAQPYVGLYLGLYLSLSSPYLAQARRSAGGRGL